MNKHQCLLCIGSNFEYIEKLSAARIALKHYFPDIIFGKEKKTKAIGNMWLSPFYNQVAVFNSTLSTENIKIIFKQIEKENGRIADDKSKGIVKLDIDLLSYDDMILKPDDISREYVTESLKELSL